MKTTTLKQLAIVSFTFFLMSCGKPSPESIIKECEACLGENKTEHELKGLSKKEISELAVCLIGPIEKMHKSIKTMEVGEATEYTKKLKAAMEQSEYVGILSDLNYERLKEMELAYKYESKTADELAKMYCEWAAKEAAAKDSDDDEAREEADMYQDAIRSVVNTRSSEEEDAFDAATENCKDH